jgi:CO/xanthine dehydrogenase Mo-binding subunit
MARSSKGRACRSIELRYLPLLRMNEATAIEVHIVKSTDAPGGMGEPSASAAMKAVFAASGKRLRKLPIVPAERAYL